MAEKSRDSSPESKHQEEDTKQKDVPGTGTNSDSPQSKLSEKTSSSTSQSSRNLSSASSVSSKRRTSSQMAGRTNDSGNIFATDQPLLPKPSDQCQLSDCSKSLQPELINTKPSSDITVASEQSNENAIATGSSTASKSLQRQPTSTGQTSREDVPPKNTNDSFCDLLENYESYRRICLPLYIAALKGDVNDAIGLLKDDTTLLGKAITERLQTVLHVAIEAKQTKFVCKMVNLLETNVGPLALQHILKLQDKKGNNAFCYAAAAGTQTIAKILLAKNNKLLEIRGFDGNTPLNIAALFGQRVMALYLKGEIDQLEKDEKREILVKEDRQNIFFLYIHNGWYDLALKLLHSDESLAVARDKKNRTALNLLAKTPSAFTSESTGRRILEILKKLLMNFTTHRSNSSPQALKLLKELWKNILCQEYSRDEEFISKHKEALFDAARFGNFKFLKELIRSYPCLVYESDKKGRSIFHIAILHRHTDTFNLIYNLGIDKHVIAILEDHKGNNLLHLAATLSEERAASMVPGAALEMQQELILFKEVELLFMPTDKEFKNVDGDTPRELFTKQHAELLERGEKWMKRTAESCSLVATLIATGVLAAAFCPPDSNCNTNGASANPRKTTAFQIFAMANAVALASSSISILTFLSILTSRYVENEFLRSLPLKLVVGIATLFVSIGAMMLAFSSSLFLTFDQHGFRGRFPIRIASLVSLPVPVFVLLQYGLFRDILYSSFRFRFSIKPGSRTSLWKGKVRRRFPWLSIGWRATRNRA